MKCRDFNNINIFENKVKKQSTHIDKLKNEMFWLEYFEDINKIGFRQISNNEYLMKNWSQAKYFDNALDEFRKKFTYNKVNDLVDNYISEDDYKEMYIDKPLNSLKTYDHHSKESKYLIYFLEYNADKILKFCYKDKNIDVIHGDLIYSNILVDGKHNFKYIDPRGSFGTRRSIFGDVEYDDAKFTTSKMGYDKVLYNSYECDFDVDINFKNERIMYKAASCLMSNLIYHNDDIFNEKQIKAAYKLIKKVEDVIWNI